MPSSVISFSVTKFRPGLHTITLASMIFTQPTLPPWRSLVDAARGEPTIDHQQIAVDEAGRLRRQEDRGARDLFRQAEALHRGAPEQLLAARRAVEKRSVQIGAEHPGRDGVDAHAAAAPFDRQ